MERGAGRAVLRHIAAFNEGDLVALLRGLTDGAVFITGADSIRGLAALEDHFGWAIANISPQLELEELLTDGPRVACRMRESFSVQGEPQEAHIAGFYRVTGGRIGWAKIYREGSADT